MRRCSARGECPFWLPCRAGGWNSTDTVRQQRLWRAPATRQSRNLFFWQFLTYAGARVVSVRDSGSRCSWSELTARTMHRQRLSGAVECEDVLLTVAWAGGG